jgi:hypothetical protein
VDQFLPAAEIRKQRVAASSRVNPFGLLPRVIGADVWRRDLTRGDERHRASKTPDEFAGHGAAAPMNALRADNVNPDPEATAIRPLAGAHLQS